MHARSTAHVASPTPVSDTGVRDRQIMQIFFPDEPLNAEDHWYPCTRRAYDLLPRRVAAASGHLHLAWDIVLVTG